MKEKSDQTISRSGTKKKFRLLPKMTRTGSNYVRMEGDGTKKKPKVLEAEVVIKDKENNGTLGNKEVKEKTKKKRSWKRIRQAALATCRYIGMGVAHLSPTAAYSSPDYYIDPKQWNKSFNSNYKPNVPNQTPHWTSTMIFSSW